MYIYLPQVHCLSFGGAFSVTPLQQRLLQHCFNTAFITSSSIATLEHDFYNTVFCNTVFYSIASTSPLQHHLLQHHFNTASALEWQ
jgi:hypothetical protein